MAGLKTLPDAAPQLLYQEHGPLQLERVFCCQHRPDGLIAGLPFLGRRLKDEIDH